jgi:hypothetical protein
MRTRKVLGERYYSKTNASAANMTRMIKAFISLRVNRNMPNVSQVKCA